MQSALSGKNILIVRGSLLAPEALEAALDENGAMVVSTDVDSAPRLIERNKFDGVVIDKGLHNEAVELRAELRSLDVRYVMAHSPHELQSPSAMKVAAAEVLRALAARFEAIRADEDLASALAARYPAVRGMASMGVVDPARF